MTKSTVRSILGIALLTVAGIPAVSAAQPKGPATSPAHFEAFNAAQKALQAGNCALTTTKAREVLAAGRKSPDDIYAANNFLVQCASRTKDNAGVIAGVEGMLNSGYSSGPGEQTLLRKALVTAYYQQNNFAQTIKHGTDLIRAGAADDDVYTVVGQSYYRNKQYNDAVKLFGGLVEADEKANRRPDRKQLTLLQDAYAKAGNEQAAQTTLEKLVRYYPTADTWLVLLYEVKKERLDPRQKLHTYRLMELTGNLKEQADFTAYADATMGLGLLNETIRVLESGIAAKAYVQETERARADRYLNSAKGRVDEARASLSPLAAEAKGAATGNEYAALGMMQYSFEQYGEAVQSFKAALAKGGLKNAGDTQLSLGAAQLKAGQKGEAAATFRAIKTNDAITQRIAKLWALYSGG